MDLIENHKLLTNASKIYRSMLKDINLAKKEILLETYLFFDDSIGRKFRDLLIKKAKEGVRVKVLVDSYGSNIRKPFFKGLEEAGGEFRLFRELRYSIRPILANHERNHRKLLIIDSKISYIGSINIAEYSISWEELVLRIKGDLAKYLRRSFFKCYKRFKHFDHKFLKKIALEGLEIIHDFPSKKSKYTEKKFCELIRSAKKEILIITPYFVPSIKIRKAFKRAVKKGARVKIILPMQSDLRFLDIFRGRYLGGLYKNGVEIYYYPKIIHSKLLVVDDDFFIVGSSNVNYRSFIYSYEINLLGKNGEILKDLKRYFNRNLKRSKLFNYEVWKRRKLITRLKDNFVNFFMKWYEEFL